MSPSQDKPLIGIVSGTGPLAGANVLQKVLKYSAEAYGAVEDSEYPDVLFYNHGIDGVDNLGSNNDSFETETRQSITYLESQGATVIGVACNTAHVHLSDMVLKKTTTLVNLIDAISTSAAQERGRYLLLTSRTTKEERLYHRYLEKYGVEFEETSEDEQVILDKIIGLVMAYQIEQAGNEFSKIIERARQRGFTSIIAGCTELPIAIDSCQDTQGIQILDSNYMLAKHLTDNYYKAKKPLSS